MTKVARRGVVLVIVVAVGALITIGLMQSFGVLRKYLPAQLAAPNRTFVDPLHRQLVQQYLESLEYLTTTIPALQPDIDHYAFDTIEGSTEVLAEYPSNQTKKVRARRRVSARSLSETADQRYAVYLNLENQILYLNRIDKETAEVVELLAFDEQWSQYAWQIAQPLISADGQYVTATAFIPGSSPFQYKTWWFNLATNQKQVTGLSDSNVISANGLRVADHQAKDVVIWDSATNRRAQLKHKGLSLHEIYEYRARHFTGFPAEVTFLDERPSIAKPRFEDPSGRFLSMYLNHQLAPAEFIYVNPQNQLTALGSFFYIYDSLTETWHLIEQRADTSTDWRPSEEQIQSVIVANSEGSQCGNDVIEEGEQCDDVPAEAVPFSERVTLVPEATVTISGNVQGNSWTVIPSGNAPTALDEVVRFPDSLNVPPEVTADAITCQGRCVSYFSLSDLPEQFSAATLVSVYIAQEMAPLRSSGSTESIGPRNTATHVVSLQNPAKPTRDELNDAVLEVSTDTSDGTGALRFRLLEQSTGKELGRQEIVWTSTRPLPEQKIYALNLVVFERRCTDSCTLTSTCAQGRCPLPSPRFSPAPDPVTPWQNPIDRFDVNNDGQVTVADAVVAVTSLREHGARGLPDLAPDSPLYTSEKPPPYYDVDGDQSLTQNDVVEIIRALGGTLEEPLLCGDGAPNQGERCDDGNTADGDGCSNLCQLEAINEPHQRLFVTSGKYLGSMNIATEAVPSSITGINRAHAICNIHAMEAGYTTFKELPQLPSSFEWLALLAAPGQPAPRQLITLPVYNMNRDKVATNAEELWSTTNERRTITDETGGILTDGARVWTGSDSSGEPTAYTCDSWYSGTFLGTGNFGTSNGEGFRWFQSRLRLPSFQSCSSTAHLYCTSRAGFTVPDTDDQVTTPNLSRLHNQKQPADVNDDDQVSSPDLWELVRYIRSNGAGPVTTASTAPPFFDVNNDQQISTADIDALLTSLTSEAERAEFVLDQDGNQEVSIDESIQTINQAIGALGTADPLYDISRNDTAAGPTLDDVIALLRTANQKAIGR